MKIEMEMNALADPADRFFFGGGASFDRWDLTWVPTPFSTFSTDLGHFVLELLNFDICMLIFYYLVIWVGQNRPLYAFGVGHGLNAPTPRWIR